MKEAGRSSKKQCVIISQVFSLGFQYFSSNARFFVLLPVINRGSQKKKTHEWMFQVMSFHLPSLPSLGQRMEWEFMENNFLGWATDSVSSQSPTAQQHVEFLADVLPGMMLHRKRCKISPHLSFSFMFQPTHHMFSLSVFLSVIVHGLPT